MAPRINLENHEIAHIARLQSMGVEYPTKNAEFYQSLWAADPVKVIRLLLPKVAMLAPAGLTDAEICYTLGCTPQMLTAVFRAGYIKLAVHARDGGS
jgi:hypothetical protein